MHQMNSVIRVYLNQRRAVIFTIAVKFPIVRDTAIVKINGFDALYLEPLQGTLSTRQPTE